MDEIVMTPRVKSAPHASARIGKRHDPQDEFVAVVRAPKTHPDRSPSAAASASAEPCDPGSATHTSVPGRPLR